ncbi:MAG: ribonuclease P protein component [Muribaculaceae bacterium]|nr:ribonuclease P protein component [Muribaculaceae bacterium]
METLNEEQKPGRRLTLRKPEKLRHKNLVNSLFAEGKSIYDFPIRLVWRTLSPQELQNAFRAEIPQQTGKLQMLITIPKKKRRRAVDRVLLRRRIREGYRLNRTHLADVIESRDDIGIVTVAFIFLGDENTPYASLEKKMINLLERLEKKLNRE